jgi:hypothetical protein
MCVRQKKFDFDCIIVVRVLMRDLTCVIPRLDFNRDLNQTRVRVFMMVFVGSQGSDVQVVLGNVMEGSE